MDWFKWIEMGLILFVSGAVLVFLWKLQNWVKGVARWSDDVNRWSDDVDKDRVVFKDFMREVRRDIKNILSILGSKDPASSSASPLKLTEFGESISTKINGKGVGQEALPKRGIADESRGKVGLRNPRGLYPVCPTGPPYHRPRTASLESMCL